MRRTKRWGGFFFLVLGLLGAVPGPGLVRAQDVLDLTEIRNPPRFTPTMGFLRAGYTFSFPSGEDKDREKRGDSFPDLSFYYITDKMFGKAANFTFYGGREGAYLSMGQPAFNLRGVRTRMEFWYRPWTFYREGFYDGNKFIPTLQYKGKEYRGRLGVLFPATARGNTFAEVAAYWGRDRFSRSSQTKEPSNLYMIPDDFQVAGVRISLETGKVLYDRYTGLPNGGALLTVWGEREVNDASGEFGTPGWESSLPSKFWRAGGRLSYYYPADKDQVLEFHAVGRYFDKEDRILTYDASKPIGNRYVQANLGYRWHLSDTMYVLPFITAQYVRVADEFNQSQDEKLFFGGGFSFRWSLGKKVSFYVDYSYLSNESREPVGIHKDYFSEHRLSTGLEITFGGL